MPSNIAIFKTAVAVCVGLAGIVGGLTLASLGYSQFGHCGAVELSVSEVSATDSQTPDEYTPYEALTPDQQAAFERALKTGEAYLSNRSGFPNIAYDGSYYIAEGPTVVCDFNPTTVMGMGGTIAVGGVLLLGWMVVKRPNFN